MSFVSASVGSGPPASFPKGLEIWEKAVSELGFGELVELYIQGRSEAGEPAKLDLLDDAAGIFFSGGDQLRITSQIGDSEVESRIRDLHDVNLHVLGTSDCFDLRNRRTFPAPTKSK